MKKDSKLVKAITNLFNLRGHHDNIGLYLLKGRYITQQQLKR
ncbi:MAG TPA: hypothetical protein VMC80_00260 [Patescibacteria group bacterium]|nr:hypothetical protein [Patescibacteria group bacterium]